MGGGSLLPEPRRILFEFLGNYSVFPRWERGSISGATCSLFQPGTLRKSPIRAVTSQFALFKPQVR
jgi:hypothetical protein